MVIYRLFSAEKIANKLASDQHEMAVFLSGNLKIANGVEKWLADTDLLERWTGPLLMFA